MLLLLLLLLDVSPYRELESRLNTRANYL
jgi:hypothetical protein